MYNFSSKGPLSFLKLDSSRCFSYLSKCLTIWIFNRSKNTMHMSNPQKYPAVTFKLKSRVLSFRSKSKWLKKVRIPAIENKNIRSIQKLRLGLQRLSRLGISLSSYKRHPNMQNPIVRGLAHLSLIPIATNKDPAVSDKNVRQPNSHPFPRSCLFFFFVSFST
jgi:hypothetical protein